MPNATRPAVDEHFTGRSPNVRATYAAILKAARKLGPVTEDAKKTSIHLVREAAFAGVATRKDALVLTLKSDTGVASPRIARQQRASANRFHLEVRLESPTQVDAELVGWMAKAYALGKAKGSNPISPPAAEPAQFAAVLLAGHKGCAVQVPFDPAVRWSLAPAPLWRGRTGHRVEGTLNGVPFVDAIVPRSGRHWLLAAEDLIASAGVAVGDRVEVRIAPLREPEPAAAPAKPRAPAARARRRR
jgi:hypothetical protein